MKQLFFLAFAVLSLSAVTTSCNKYEEGPMLSVRSAEYRIIRTWEVDKYIYADGTEENGDSDDPVYTFTKDGEVSITDGNFTYTGDWDLNGDKDEITLEYSYGSFAVIDNYEIIRLTVNEFWVEDENGDQTHLVAK